jgi:hypothetical protein
MGKSLKDATGGDVMGMLDTGGPDVWFIDVDDDGTAYTWCAELSGPAYLPEDEIQHVRDYHAGKFMEPWHRDACLGRSLWTCDSSHQNAGNWSHS